MGKIITFGTLKGGVGKTMLCFNIGGILAQLDRRVLVIDSDLQGNLTNNMGIDRTRQDLLTTYDIYRVDNPPPEPQQLVLQAPISQLPLGPVGGAFRQEVWKLLCEIPYGQVTTYGEIAKKMAAKANRPSMSSQAVGGAVGHNPISIIIPCHRVVGATGSLTGYAGGISKKLWLLEHEGVDVSRLSIPKRGTAL